MVERFRESQVVHGEIQPRNSFVGRGACLEIGQVTEAFHLEGIDLHAIPTIRTINAVLNNKGLLKAGTIIGIAKPATEKDSANVIIWDGDGLMTMSAQRYQQKLSSGTWNLKMDTTTTQYPADEVYLEKEKKKKHVQPRRQKEKRGRRV